MPYFVRAHIQPEGTDQWFAFEDVGPRWDTWAECNAWVQTLPEYPNLQYTVHAEEA